jgi:hypothetical protein
MSNTKTLQQKLTDANSAHTVRVLRHLGTVYKISGRSSMNKATLVAAIVDHLLTIADPSAAGDDFTNARALLDQCTPEQRAAAIDADHTEAFDLDEKRETRSRVPQVEKTPAPKGSVELHTAGELHAAPQIGRVTFTFNLSDLLADPARKLPENLIELDGTDARVEDFVFATPGAVKLYLTMSRLINQQIKRGKRVVVLILCRGGKHRSVAFGQILANQLGAQVTHHHKHLSVVRVTG